MPCSPGFVNEALTRAVKRSHEVVDCSINVIGEAYELPMSTQLFKNTNTHTRMPSKSTLSTEAG